MLHASTEKAGVDVFIPEEEGLENAPHCPHGPMLLFERYFQDKSSRKFFACSACRDRKQCPFFQWFDETISTTRQTVHQEIIENSKPPFTHPEFTQRLEQIKKLPRDKDRLYCQDCSLLLLPKEVKQHKEHNLKSPVSLDMLLRPTEWLNPMENRKSNAQYFFSSKAAQFTISHLQSQGTEKVVCIGTPRLHEEIQSKRETDKDFALDSLLLDIDMRFMQFYSQSQFCHYNMFTHYFFSGEASRKCFIDFLSSEGKVAMVIDPPFGGLVSVLAATIKKIWQIHKNHGKGNPNSMDTYLVFPYFLESHVTEALPTLVMMDYKVNYENHPLFKKASRSNKRNSPVRIFTNITPEDFVLSADEGYRFCKLCRRYVATENKHCAKCKCCPSKDGRTYQHCDQCQRCVKPGRQHCETCNQCDLPNHSCSSTRKQLGCHICGEFGHKRKDCPTKESSTLQTSERSCSTTSAEKSPQKRKKTKDNKTRKKIKTKS